MGCYFSILSFLKPDILSKQKRISLLAAVFCCWATYSQYIDITNPPYYAIPNDGKDDASAIQKAIDRNPGKTIFIPAGIFHIQETLVIGHSMEIIGEKSNHTIFSPLDCHAFLIKSSNVTLRNMRIKGAQNSNNTFTGIQSIGQKGQQLHGLHIERVGIQNMNTGIALHYTSGALIDKVRMTIPANQGTAVREGIRFYGKCVHNSVSNCHIASDLAGITIIRAKPDAENSFDLTAMKSEIAEGLIITNSFLNYGNYGVRAEGVLRMNISNCTIHAARKTAIAITRSDEILLSANHISSNSNVASNPIIKLTSSSDGVIIGNSITATANNDVGIYLAEGSKNCTITGNRIKGVHYKTYHTSGSIDNKVINNH